MDETVLNFVGNGCALRFLVLRWAEPVEGGWVLRLHETLGRCGNRCIAAAKGTKATPADLLGQPLVGTKAASGEVALPITLYQVRSVKFGR